MRKTGSFSRAIVGFMVNIQRKRGNGFKLPRVGLKKAIQTKKPRQDCLGFFVADSTVLNSGAE